ncbi:SRPBCC family protein [Aeromicrobium stalagmiti]|uniref:SRPBCC family protein n=1 Tax=Aeromicrobium stalagmiti TaxID=2738988 RepID=UPI0015697C97|nr:SRPBCC family protein [Aeromicrobium stalagmiti]NRQ50724.1 SRPBCC family protein [Aeromicrobium stalagmiti]
MGDLCGLPYVWGATAGETARTYPSEAFAPAGAERAMRAIDVAATPEATYAWICQLRRAPYSYDLIDNLGRRSPRDLDPTMLDLEPGMRIAMIFRVVDFVPDESVTMEIVDARPRRWFGPLVFTYAIAPRPGGCRLIGVIDMPPARSPIARARRWLLMWGDLVMMRKQLMTLGRLAEQQP